MCTRAMCARWYLHLPRSLLWLVRMAAEPPMRKRVLGISLSLSQPWYLHPQVVPLVSVLHPTAIFQISQTPSPPISDLGISPKETLTFSLLFQQPFCVCPGKGDVVLKPAHERSFRVCLGITSHVVVFVFQSNSSLLYWGGWNQIDGRRRSVAQAGQEGELTGCE